MIEIILILLVVYRMTRLVVHDRVTADIREGIQRFFERRYLRKYDLDETDEWQSPIAYLLSCMWCMSIWISAFITLTALPFTGIDHPILVWLAASSVTGLLSSWEGRG